jgi:hypothetical protein
VFSSVRDPCGERPPAVRTAAFAIDYPLIGKLFVTKNYDRCQLNQVALKCSMIFGANKRFWTDPEHDMNQKAKRTMQYALLPAAVVLIFAMIANNIKPDQFGHVLYVAALFFGGIGALAGFVAGLLAGRAESRVAIEQIDGK